LINKKTMRGAKKRGGGSCGVITESGAQREEILKVEKGGYKKTKEKGAMQSELSALAKIKKKEKGGKGGEYEYWHQEQWRLTHKWENDISCRLSNRLNSCNGTQTEKEVSPRKTKKRGKEGEYNHSAAEKKKRWENLGGRQLMYGGKGGAMKKQMKGLLF